MGRLLATVTALLLQTMRLQGETTADARELTKLLQAFLDGASRNDAAMHDRFWADDLIYTGSAGRRVSKADIMNDVRSAPAAKPGAPSSRFTAEEVRIQQYGDTAIVAFRLVGTTQEGGKASVAKYLNTGTFLKRNAQWRAVSWQATSIPRPEEESKKEVAAVEAAFHRALLAADVESLEATMHPSFVWTHDDGEQTTRQNLLDEIGSGKLKHSKLETDKVAVAMHGSTAVVRGVSRRQRSAIPGSPSAGGTDFFTAFYTLTLVVEGGSWKAVALHTSLPE